MAIMETFKGLNILALPCDVVDGVRGPSSIEGDRQEMVSEGPASMTGQVQVYDFMTSWWEAQVSFAPMARLSYDAWTAFIGECRGPLDAFMIGDRTAAIPKGQAEGVPVVAGSAQTGYSLATRGWAPSTFGQLMVGDFIQVGYRLYHVLDLVNSDGSGHATLKIWPNLRDLPADGTSIKLTACKGLFRLKNSSGNKASVNVGLYGCAGFAIREAF
jgi:hypothetical protein